MEGYGFEDDIELDIDLGKVQQRHLGNLLCTYMFIRCDELDFFLV